jgi:hypothetical protein
VTAADDVRDAWVDPGPAPVLHRAHQVRLRREWPALAQALDRLAAPERVPSVVATVWTTSGLNNTGAPPEYRNPNLGTAPGYLVRLFIWSDGLTTLTPERTP